MGAVQKAACGVRVVDAEALRFRVVGQCIVCIRGLRVWRGRGEGPAWAADPVRGWGLSPAVVRAHGAESAIPGFEDEDDVVALVEFQEHVGLVGDVVHVLKQDAELGGVVVSFQAGRDWYRWGFWWPKQANLGPCLIGKGEDGLLVWVGSERWLAEDRSCVGPRGESDADPGLVGVGKFEGGSG